MKFVLLSMLVAVLVAVGDSNPAILYAPVVDEYDINARNDDLLRYIWTLRYLQWLKSVNDQQLASRFGDDGGAAAVPSVKPAGGAVGVPTLNKPPQCKQVGEPCVYHQDCCSNACPSYWGKCVSG